MDPAAPRSIGVPALRDKLGALYARRRSTRAVGYLCPEYLDMLARLGSPQNRLPPVIHVAGTNGKGSVVAYMRAILAAAGYRVHAYTSPHLLRFNERIVLAGQEIGDSQLEFYLDRVLAAADGADLSFFDIATALAFLAFADVPGDVVLLETGLGGRLDSTNVVSQPLVCAITALSYDHTEFLGETIAAIAAEKAGIIKRGVPCVVAPQIYEAVFPVLREKAAAMGAAMMSFNAGGGAALTVQPDGFRLGLKDETIDLPLPALSGAHQITNAATAVLALRIQDGLKIPFECYARGLAQAHWPARLQKLKWPDLPAGWDVWLDGGHNDSAALVLADQIRVWQVEDHRPVHIVTGMMGHKRADDFTAPLAPLASSVGCLGLDPEKAYLPEALGAVWTKAGASRVVAVPEDGLAAHLQRLCGGGQSGHILLTGSLYLAEYLARAGFYST